MITNNFLWHGVVEDINDPLKLGRVRVRIYGVHDPRTSFADGSIGLTTEDLPWAHVLTQGAAMNGIGLSPSFVVQGTWVTGYFRDSFKQEPIVTGALNGFANLGSVLFADTFCDPDGVYPLNDHLNEQDVNRLARNDFEDNPGTMLDGSSPVDAYTIVPHGKEARHQILIDKGANRTLDIRQVGGTVWEEPYQSYSATYPNNLVMETTGGLIKEYDSTPGSERIHEYHKSGSFYEIRPDGSKITKLVGSDYEITVMDKNVLISGNLNVTVIGDSNLVVQGNVTQEVDGNVTQTILQNVTQDITGNVGQTIGGNVTQDITGNVTQTVGGSVNQTISGDLTSASANMTLNSSGNMTLQAGGAASITSGGAMVINGAVINIG